MEIRNNSVGVSYFSPSEMNKAEGNLNLQERKARNLAVSETANEQRNVNELKRQEVQTKNKEYIKSENRMETKTQEMLASEQKAIENKSQEMFDMIQAKNKEELATRKEFIDNKQYLKGSVVSEYA